MAHRARSQTVLAQRWSAAGVVGAVGKASIGFSLAVGRSGAIRPTVRVDDLNSAALRPSLDAWSKRASGADDLAAVPVASVASADRVDERSARRPVANEHRHRPAPPVVRRRHVARATRPTWTDQVIERSAVGYTAPPAASVVSGTAVPADFVATGDPKLDQLRLLVRQQAEAAQGRPSARPESATNAARHARERTSALPGERGHTAAGPSTGPGQLARTLRPEPIGDTERRAPTARPAALAPTSTPASERTADTVRRSATAESERRPARGRTAEVSKMDALRAALIERGLLPDSAATPAGEPAPGQRSGPDDRDDRGRRDTDREARADHGSTPRRGERTDGSSPTSASTDSGRPMHTSESLRRSVVERSPRGHDTNAGGPPQASSRLGSTPDAGDTVTWGAEPVAPNGPVRGRQDGVPVAARSVASTPATVPSNQRLRAQRLLSSGLAPVARALTEMQASSDGTTLVQDRDDAFGEFDGQPVRPPAIDPSTGVLRRTPVTESFRSTPETAPAESAPTRPDPTRSDPTRPDPTRAAQLPRLAPVLSPRAAAGSVDAVRAPVLRRRVTLPRALSRAHRPTTQLSSAILEPNSPEASLLGRSSTTPSPTSTTGPISGPTSTPAPTGPDEHPRSIPRTAAARSDTIRRTAAVPGLRAPDVVGRSHALLDVIRRQTDRPLASSAPLVQRVAAAPRTASRPTPRSPQTGRSVPGTEEFERADADRLLAPTLSPVTTPVGSPSSAIVDGRPGDRDGGARPIAPAERVAEQFMTELSRSVRSRPAPLPMSFQPLAEAIAGPRPVMLSTDAASRRALRSVGKVAATTGDTIHLDRASIAGARLNEVMAHELTHVAAPSPAPRFFDDVDDSPEERRAEQVGRLMARSPLAPSASVVAPAGGATLRRSPAARPARSAPGGHEPTMAASDLAARISGATTGSATRREPDVIRRWVSAQPGAQPDGRRPVMGNRPAPAPPAPAPAPVAAPPSEVQHVESAYSLQGDAMASKWFEQQLAAHLQPLIRMIEDRMIVELERRGGRSWRSS